MFVARGLSFAGPIRRPQAARLHNFSLTTHYRSNNKPPRNRVSFFRKTAKLSHLSAKSIGPFSPSMTVALSVVLARIEYSGGIVIVCFGTGAGSRSFQPGGMSRVIGEFDSATLLHDASKVRQNVAIASSIYKKSLTEGNGLG